MSLPFDKDANVDRKPWPHVDQSPNRRFKHCVQGIMNLVSAASVVKLSGTVLIQSTRMDPTTAV